MLQVLDGLLLLFIFVELLYAVRACLRSHEIVAEPFLIVGILAGIKEIVVLSVEAAALLEKGPAFARAVVEIGVLGAVVLVLAVAALVLRERRTVPDTAASSARRNLSWSLLGTMRRPRLSDAQDADPSLGGAVARHWSVRAASSSEPPASVGLARRLSRGFGDGDS